MLKQKNGKKQIKKIEPISSPRQLFELGSFDIAPAALDYDEHERIDVLFYLHTHGYFGCVSPEIELQNQLSSDWQTGTIISVYPTIYGGDALVIRTILEHEVTYMYFTTCYGEEHHDWLQSAVVDFTRYVTPEFPRC